MNKSLNRDLIFMDKSWVMNHAERNIFGGEYKDFYNQFLFIINKFFYCL